MQLQTVTISAYLLWWVQEPASTTWTKGAARPCTTLLLLTLMESEYMWMDWICLYMWMEKALYFNYMSLLDPDIEFVSRQVPGVFAEERR